MNGFCMRAIRAEQGGDGSAYSVCDIAGIV
jgi:hypothetical protein